jgi:nitroimidazol reductase NimA-like FMN-containing flavoprotein (pyridoxamine 5'-phosphate oxidase superfamily)
MMMDNSDLRLHLRSLLKSQNLAVLSTCGEEGPYASLISFAATEDLKTLIFATGRSTRKYANLSKNPRVALLVDSRSNRVTDFRDAIAATATGVAEEAAKPEREKYAKIYLAKHPHLSEFLESPNTTLLKIRVDRYIIVSHFQYVVEMEVTGDE